MKRIRLLLTVLLVFAIAFGAVGPAMAAPPEAPVLAPSTPDDNKANGWAYHEAVAVPGGVEITLYAPRNFSSCIEYRVDDEAPKVFPHTYLVLSPLLSDGEFTFLCGHGVNAPVQTIFVPANSHVDIRMPVGAEGDERYYEWYRHSAGAGSSVGGSSTGEKGAEGVCRVLGEAPKWIPYGDVGVWINWSANGLGCGLALVPVNGGNRVLLHVLEKRYPDHETRWIGRVSASGPDGYPLVDEGWYRLGERPLRTYTNSQSLYISLVLGQKI